METALKQKVSDEIVALIIAADLPISPTGTPIRKHGGTFARALAHAPCANAIRILLADVAEGGLGYGKFARTLLSAAYPCGTQLVAHLDHT